ncbi:hypothetical protein BSL78_00227 [Apostichopus japonicus]|uniref:HECT-type E3 ubiquitin transferase n=1 Tax=Stichopus japonicus TaxID=307972 RepID=A0A2G8LR82_STIJA|nr:hypothetical protein BSL78_00227 [Apostichopus japonicus]
MYALFRTSPGDRVTYIPNPSSHCNPNHLSYFKFVGRIIAKAIYDNKLLECYFSRSFYKHILGKAVTYSDMESEDYAFYQGLVFLSEHHVSELGYELTFSTEIEEFGVTETRDLKPDGANTTVTEDNKLEYVRLVCQMKMTGAIRKQIDSFLDGFYDIIPKRLISIFDEQELELLISGLPTVDVDDLKSNTEYHKYQSNSLQIQWFWRALRSFVKLFVPNSFICDGNIQSTPARLWFFGRHERPSEVPDPQGRQIHRKTADRSHLFQSTGPSSL